MTFDLDHLERLANAGCPLSGSHTLALVARIRTAEAEIARLRALLSPEWIPATKLPSKPEPRIAYIHKGVLVAASYDGIYFLQHEKCPFGPKDGDWYMVIPPTPDESALKASPNLADERTAAPNGAEVPDAKVCRVIASEHTAAISSLHRDLSALSANFDEFHALAEKRDKDVEGKLAAMDDRIRSDDPTLTIPGDRMAIDSAPGTEVVFDARGGTDADKNKAEINLKRGRKYAVHSTKIASWYTEVWIKDSAGKITGPWNHCLFGKIAPAPSAPQSDEPVDLDAIIDAASQEAFGPSIQPLSRWTDKEKKEARLIASRCFAAGESSVTARIRAMIEGITAPPSGYAECAVCFTDGFRACQSAILAAIATDAGRKQT